MKRVSILHADHGIPSIMIRDAVRTLVGQGLEQGFFARTVPIDKEDGQVVNRLRGPASGEPVVPESKVSYSARGDRPWKDRMCTLPATLTRELTIVGTWERSEDYPDGNFTVFTAYGGPLAPQNPEDPSNSDPEASRLFWASHALTTAEVTPQ